MDKYSELLGRNGMEHYSSLIIPSTSLSISNFETFMEGLLLPKVIQGGVGQGWPLFTLATPNPTVLNWGHKKFIGYLIKSFFSLTLNILKIPGPNYSAFQKSFINVFRCFFFFFFSNPYHLQEVRGEATSLLKLFIINVNF